MSDDNDFKDIVRDITSLTIGEGLTRLILFLGVAFIIGSFLHLETTPSLVLAGVLMLYIYVGRKALYGRTTANKRK